MSFKRFAAAELAAMVAFTLCSTSIAGAASVRSVTVFAEGGAVNASAPDSIAVDDLEFGSLFASVGSVHALVSVLRNGTVSPFVGNLSGPHGLVFLPQPE